MSSLQVDDSATFMTEQCLYLAMDWEIKWPWNKQNQQGCTLFAPGWCVPHWALTMEFKQPLSTYHYFSSCACVHRFLRESYCLNVCSYICEHIGTNAKLLVRIYLTLILFKYLQISKMALRFRNSLYALGIYNPQ